MPAQNYILNSIVKSFPILKTKIFQLFRAEERTDESSYTFSGDGYAVLQHDSASIYNKYLFSVSLSFKTFDANAIIFIGVGNDQVLQLLH